MNRFKSEQYGPLDEINFKDGLDVLRTSTSGSEGKQLYDLIRDCDDAELGSGHAQVAVDRLSGCVVDLFRRLEVQHTMYVYVLQQRDMLLKEKAIPCPRCLPRPPASSGASNLEAGALILDENVKVINGC